MIVLSVNAGSSSLKYALHRVGSARQALQTLGSGVIQGLRPGADTFARALVQLREWLDTQAHHGAVGAVAHRVVHGGARLTTSVLVTDDILDELQQLAPLAPLHQPYNLQGLRAMRDSFEGVPQVACFDTAFHAGLSDVETRFALPARISTSGVRRYGFHGLAYQHVMQTLQSRSTAANGRVLMAHLGSGASLCAALGGRSHATTMGFSALDGLMMGTRCGALDPGVVLHLLDQGSSTDELRELLYRQSGLLGVSGLSGDMRALRADGGEAAQAAIKLFTHRVVRECGAMIACMGGLDLLAFSGGIGEHDAVLRAQVCGRLGWLGLRLDEPANNAATGQQPAPVHAPHSSVQVWVVPADEGSVAALEAARIVGDAGGRANDPRPA